jgi:hypothetical protein
MTERLDHDIAGPPLPRHHTWAVTCCALGATSFFLLGPLALSFFLWVDAWLYQLEYPILTYSQKWFWDLLRWLYVLGPEIVLALAALIVGIIAVARRRKTPGWQRDEALVTAGCPMQRWR